jgi:GNAT superfamily N-acetyltransferase
MEIIIKRATIKDLSQIQTLNLKLFKKEYQEYDPLLNLDWTFGEIGTKYFKERLGHKHSCILTAIIKNKTVGYLCGSLLKKEAYRHTPAMAKLENIFVLDKYRSQGVGGKLYQEFAEWCRVKKVKKIKVNAYAKNKRAIKFYKENKFKENTLTLEADL